METVVGFAVGFVVGTKEGRAGLAKIKESLAYIRESKEMQNLVGTALTVVYPMMKELTAGSGRHA
ncbi:hypothetical protein [Sporichthya sp.]|uniref:hypothetical protein n=1 Tax=Sporichthya sp. TaxID=65475 RepID=UPI00179EC0D8|nr:hypothetical protein [Sporichthya sp.]MBA3743722.1 hypothetical protein [Sporichthya sp.]